MLWEIFSPLLSHKFLTDAKIQYCKRYIKNLTSSKNVSIRGGWIGQSIIPLSPPLSPGSRQNMKMKSDITAQINGDRLRVKYYSVQKIHVFFYFSTDFCHPSIVEFMEIFEFLAPNSPGFEMSERNPYFSKRSSDKDYSFIRRELCDSVPQRGPPGYRLVTS